MVYISLLFSRSQKVGIMRNLYIEVQYLIVVSMIPLSEEIEWLDN
jgi:hypothetical protein